MQFTSALLVAFSAVGIMAQNGQRFCAGGGISCEYPKGRCAKVCEGPAPGFATTCDCPDGQDDNPYTGASCITVLQAYGRTNC